MCPEGIRPDDDALAEGFLHGEPIATRQIVDWVSRVVRLRAWRLRRDEDLVQDVLLELMRVLAAGRFEGRSSLRTFVERVAKYRCIDAVRRDRRQALISWKDSGEPEPAHDDHPERQLAQRDEIRLCRAVLDHLPESCRALLHRVLAEDTAYEVLAKEMGVATGTVKSRVARCRERANALRRRLLAIPEAWRHGGDA